MKLLSPALAKLVVPGADPALRLAGRSLTVLPALVKTLDGITRAELYLEKPFKKLPAS